MQRLDKIISLQFNISRSIARRDIRRGCVSVSGDIVRDPAFQVEPQNAQIEYKGQAMQYRKHIYIIMNKPSGILSASNDKKRQTVVDLVPLELRRAGLFPVGRLDKDTTGLLLITDDGQFAHDIISPNKKIFKTYEAALDGEITDGMIELFAKGVTLADGTVCRPAKLKALGNCQAEIEISEGKYHQIKRMFGAVGLGVNSLNRTALGGLHLPEDLSLGDCREITKEELVSIVDI